MSEIRSPFLPAEVPPKPSPPNLRTAMTEAFDGGPRREAEVTEHCERCNGQGRIFGLMSSELTPCPAGCTNGRRTRPASSPESMVALDEDGKPREPGCRCHQEEGDSPCPIHSDAVAAACWNLSAITSAATDGRNLEALVGCAREKVERLEAQAANYRAEREAARDDAQQAKEAHLATAERLTRAQISLSETEAHWRDEQAEVAALREELATAEAYRRAVQVSVVEALGGEVEGAPTSTLNYLQRARALVEIERRRDEHEAGMEHHADALVEKLATAEFQYGLLTKAHQEQATSLATAERERDEVEQALSTERYEHRATIGQRDRLSAQVETLTKERDEARQYHANEHKERVAIADAIAALKGGGQ